MEMDIESAITRFEAYLVSQRRLSRNTCYAYTRDVMRYIAFIKKSGCNNMQQNQLNTYMHFLSKSGYSSASRRRILASLRSFFYFWSPLASKNGGEYIDNIVTPQVTHGLPSYCTPEEIRKLMSSFADSGGRYAQRDALLLLILYATGMRVSELISLKLSDIKIKELLIAVHGKGGKTRMIPVSKEIVEQIVSYIGYAPRNTRNQPLFSVKYRGKISMMSRQSVWKIIARLGSNILNKRVFPHMMRHSIATHCLQNGWNVRALQAFLGHAKMATVELYTHIDMQHAKSVFRKHPRF